MPRGPALWRAAAVLLGLATAAYLLLIGWLASADLPRGALDPGPVSSRRISDRRGVLLREALSRRDGRSNWVGLDQISPQIIAATLAGEDHRFYRHHGVDWRATLRALWQNTRAGRVRSGASTITMQLVRLLDPRRRSYAAKLRQAALATRLERSLSKETILWQYLNRAPYGNGTFGVEAAARRYFGKPASSVSLAEAALLAALPRSPSGYDPFRRGRARLIARQRYLLSLMVSRHQITKAQARIAWRQPIDFARARRPFDAPHLVQRLLAAPRYRRAASLQTTLDLELQRQAQTAVRDAIARLADRGAKNAAAVVVDNGSGDVLAYVGSASFFDAESAGQVDGAVALRQPGSTLKPFTYGVALEQDLTPASLLEDLPAHFTTAQGDYAPKNYDRRFHGPVRLRVALGSSYNVPAVRVAGRVGVGRLLDRLRAAGIKALTRGANHYGLGLTLGDGEVNLLQLTAAYVALARGGIYRPLRLVLRARRADGREIKAQARPSRRIFSRQVSYLLSDILSDAAARSAAFGRNTPLEVGFPAAVKTGTSKDFRDNWTVGYTPEVTVGVWVGNVDNTPMRRVSGITGAGPLWAELLRAASRRYGSQPHRFKRPERIVSATICPLSGALAGPLCAGRLEEHFIEGRAPRHRCAIHREMKIDRRNGLRADGLSCPVNQVESRVFAVYPPRYRAWAAKRGILQPPTVDSPLCAPRRHPAPAAVRIRFPSDGDQFAIDPDLRRRYQRIPLEAVVHGRVRQVRWLVDGRRVASAEFPYRAKWTIAKGKHTVIAELPGGQRSAPVRIRVQ